jgi:predicted small lipoprotein YifL
MSFRSLLVIASVALVAGCDRREPLARPDTAVAPVPVEHAPRTAYLSVSDVAPESGATIVVAANISLGDSLSIGSFRVRLLYDSGSLAYVDEVPAPGMLRVVNARPNEIIIAGASSSGAAIDDRLFTLRFRVNDAAGVQTLMLRIDELNDANYATQAQSVTRSPAIVLDPSLDQTRIPRR